jgi:ubiquinone/menaquinone biosynthesis C-methylase UbiE
VVALEVNANRAAGGARLTRRVGLAGRVCLIRGDAQHLPFADSSFDACISQEVLLHVADKAATLAGCRRVLRPGGRLAFTDWVAHPRLADREREQLRAWMAATHLQTLTSYPLLLGRAGFAWAETEDLSVEWRAILRQRVAEYRRRRHDLVARLGDTHYREYDQLFTFLIALVDQGKLGSGRFWAAR